MNTPFHPLCEELGIPRRQRKSILTGHLREGEWSKSGRGGKIVLTEEGERKVRIYAECADSSPEMVPYFSEFQICRLMPNPRWVMIKVDAETAMCAIPIALHKFMHVGKRIRVEVVSDRNGTSYRHEKLAAH